MFWQVFWGVVLGISAVVVITMVGLVALGLAVQKFNND